MVGWGEVVSWIQQQMRQFKGLDYRNSKRQVLNMTKVSLKSICVHAYLLTEIYSVGNIGFQKLGLICGSKCWAVLGKGIGFLSYKCSNLFIVLLVDLAFVFHEHLTFALFSLELMSKWLTLFMFCCFLNISTVNLTIMFFSLLLCRSWMNCNLKPVLIRLEMSVWSHLTVYIFDPLIDWPSLRWHRWRLKFPPRTDMTSQLCVVVRLKVVS